PPLAPAMAVELPPVASPITTRTGETIGSTSTNSTALLTLPPRCDTAVAEPPEPPSPPSTVPLREFCAPPVRPEVADPEVRAPELAVLVAWPNAVALPVTPELPESPEVAVPPRAEALPGGARVVGVIRTVGAPG